VWDSGKDHKVGRVLKSFFKIAGLITGLFLLSSCFFGGSRTSDKVPVERVSMQQVEGVETSRRPAGLEDSSPHFLLGSGTATFQSKPLRRGQIQFQNRRALPKKPPLLRKTKVESPRVVDEKIEKPMTKASVQQSKPPTRQAVAVPPPKLASPTTQLEVPQVTVAEVHSPDLPNAPVMPLVTEDLRSLVEPPTQESLGVPQANLASPSAQAKKAKAPIGQIKSKLFAKPSTPQTPNPLGGRASIALSNGTAGPVRLVGLALRNVGPTFATVVIESDKPILNYKSFALPDPPRLVVDISEAVHALPMRVKRIAKGPVKNVRTSQFSTTPDWVTRVVIDLSKNLPYRIHAVPGPMQIVVGEPAPSSHAIIPVAAVSPGAAVPPPVPPEALAPPPVISVAARTETLPGLSKRISVDLRQIDILAVMKFLAEEGELNIVTGKNVGGRVSLSLKDVSIRDVLDIISLSYELSYVVQNGIIHVMTEADYQRLFGSSFADQRQVRRLQLQHADPTSVAALLGNLKSTVGRVIADVQTRTIVLIDVPEKLEPMVAAAKSMDQATEQKTQVFELGYGKAEEVSAEVQKVLTPNLGAVRMDKRTNTLVVTDVSRRMKDVQRVINAFDRKTREVIIESKIIQVRLNDKFQMGVNWEVLFQQLSNLNLKGTFPISPPVGPLGPVGQLTVGTLADNDFTAVIQLLQTVGTTDVLSTPQIAVVENEEAKILVGTREAFVTSVVTSTQSASTTAEEVTFVDVGVQLTVTPSINQEGFVTMKIKPEVSSVTRTLTTATGNEIPIVQTSTAETTVMVRDGVTIIIAGLIENQSIEETKKVPILGDIPFLGAAFRSKDEEIIKSELVIFLTPSIISGKESMAGIASRP